MSKFEKLLSPLKIKNLELANRIVFPPFETNYATEDSFATENTIRFYSRIAQGGPGLMIVEATNINPEPKGKFTKFGLGAFDDKFLPGLKRLVNSVHSQGPVKIALQIVDKSLLASQRYVADLSVEEIKRIVDYFARGVVRTREAGFDAVDFHWAHPYSGSDFLSKRGNTRRDSYGNSVKGRMTMGLEVIAKARKEAGEDFPISVRFNAEDFVPGGNTLLHTTVIAKEFEKAGVDILNVTAGGRRRDDQDGYSMERGILSADFPFAANVYLAEAIREGVKIPVITVGRINTPQLAEDILQKGKADLIAVARGMFRDPDFAIKTKEGREKEILKCTYCNACHAFYRYTLPVQCCFKDWLGMFNFEGMTAPSAKELKALVDGYNTRAYLKGKSL